MNLNDYAAIWKRQELPVGADADLSDLKQTFEATRRKMERIILFRNITEGVGGILGSAGLGLFSWKLGLMGWPIILGLILVCGVSCVFLHDWWRFHGAKLGPEAPMLPKLEANIAELRHQRSFMSHYGKWYIGSYSAAMLLFVYGISRPALRGTPPDFFVTLLTTPSTAVLIALLLIIPIGATAWWWLDIQKVIRLRIDPRLAELEKLRADLLSNS